MDALTIAFRLKPEATRLRAGRYGEAGSLDGWLPPL